MRYILTGDDKTVQNVLKENRIRIKRGLLSITPLDESETESADENVNDFADDKQGDNGDDAPIDNDNKDVIVNDGKEIAEEDDKKPRGRKKKEE